MCKLLSLIFASLCLILMLGQTHAAARQHKTASALPAVKTFRNCKGCPEMVVIPSGSFDMGSPVTEDERDDNEGPVHRVKITRFALGKTEVTRGQFALFVRKTGYVTGDKCWTLQKGKYEERTGSWRDPGYPQKDDHPVTCINWNDAQAYAKWLSLRSGHHYRLPTEAEWEYAARGKTSTARYWGDHPDAACSHANGADQTAQEMIPGATSWLVHHCTDGFAYTAPAGSFKLNAFGLDDMLGNVWEWIEDSFHDNYAGTTVNARARHGDGRQRLLRGGSWNNAPRDLRAAVRYASKLEVRFSTFGFRLALSLK